MTKGKKIGLAVFGLLLAVIIVAAVWPKDNRAAWETATVEKGSVTQTADMTGAITYQDIRHASFLMSGRLDTLKVAVGDHVEQGELLATLRDSSGYPVLSDVQKGMLRLVSPIDGVVTATYAQPGDTVSAGGWIATIQGPAGDFEVTMQVSENDVADIMVGDDVDMKVGALDDAMLFGEILSIAPAATENQAVVSYTVIASVDGANSDGKGALSQLRAGMTVDVSVVTSEAKDVLVIPRRAITTRDGKPYVNVVSDNAEGYVEREIATGLRGDNGNVVVINGLTEGEEIIVDMNE